MTIEKVRSDVKIISYPVLSWIHTAIFLIFYVKKIINESCLTQCWIDTAIIILYEYIIVMNLDVFAK